MTDLRTGCPDKPVEPPENIQHIASRCYVCKEDIYAGEIYYDFDGDMVHEDCANDYVRRYKK